jgi:hypothetical protein
MNIEEIEKFLEKQKAPQGQIKINFRKRDTIYGLFVKGDDYTDLKSKNFWRIITLPNVPAWEKSKNINLAKIFNGSEFSRLSAKD